jgi:hypothetical protein
MPHVAERVPDLTLRLGDAAHLEGDVLVVDDEAAVRGATIHDLAWTMRFELPLVVSRSTYARDPRSSEGKLAFRWQLSLSPSFVRRHSTSSGCRAHSCFIRYRTSAALSGPNHGPASSRFLAPPSTRSTRVP